MVTIAAPQLQRSLASNHFYTLVTFCGIVGEMRSNLYVGDDEEISACLFRALQ
jgi:hypothetical protein